ncbi:MAG: hypothetical protein H0U85_06170, partial [Gemmatimonadales bacterium]|nr:hypothetical protein [Gemmatimonadales bacterium]
MPQRTGTHDVSSTFAARMSAIPNFTGQNMDRVQQGLDQELAAHNQLMMQLVDEMCDITSDRLRTYGAASGGSMLKVDEYGRGPTQVSVPGETAGFPLDKWQYAVGWTDTWFRTKAPIDLAVQVQAAEVADKKAVVYAIKSALFGSANYTVYDHLVDNISLAVKRLVNADGAAIPVGPNGESFTASTHTHYNGYAALNAANMLDNINDVVEHGYGGAVRVYISTTDEAAVRALTGFSAYLDPRLMIGAVAANQINSPRLDITRLDNRAIGIYGPAEVWVKPWMIASYQFAFDSAGPKPLAFRQRSQDTIQGLRVAGEIPVYPLLSR